VDGKFWEFLGFMNRFNWQSSSNMTSVNLDAWNKLSKKNQDIIEKLAAEMQPVFWQSSKDEDEVKLKTLADQGIKITSPTADLKKDLVRVGMKMWEEFIADTGPAAAETIKKYRADIGK
jgi:TRAP-type C4-dicarboxylate transport system substrate-binding protein